MRYPNLLNRTIYSLLHLPDWERFILTTERPKNNEKKTPIIDHCLSTLEYKNAGQRVLVLQSNSPSYILLFDCVLLGGHSSSTHHHLPHEAKYLVNALDMLLFSLLSLFMARYALGAQFNVTVGGTGILQFNPPTVVRI